VSVGKSFLCLLPHTNKIEPVQVLDICPDRIEPTAGDLDADTHRLSRDSLQLSSAPVR